MNVIKKVQFHSKHRAQMMVPNDKMAIISVRQPAEWVELNRNWQHVLELEFHDTDGTERENNLPIFTADGIDIECLVAFDKSMAQQVIDFANKMQELGIEELHVHCHAGISRSAAIAKFLCDLPYVAEDFPDSYMVYNKLVYRVLRNTYYGLDY